MKTSINFNIKGQHESHNGFAVVPLGIVGREQRKPRFVSPFKAL